MHLGAFLNYNSWHSYRPYTNGIVHINLNRCKRAKERTTPTPFLLTFLIATGADKGRFFHYITKYGRDASV